jgi:hypothetical protein
MTAFPLARQRRRKGMEAAIAASAGDEPAVRGDMNSLLEAKSHRIGTSSPGMRHIWPLARQNRVVVREEQSVSFQ